MADEKKETLSVEEMKNAVSMATFLPDLLRIIQETNNKVTALNDNFTKQAVALNTYTKTISEAFTRLEAEIKNLKEGQPNYEKDFEKISKEIEDIKKTVLQANDPFGGIQITGATQHYPDGRVEKVDLKGPKTENKPANDSKKQPAKGEKKDEEYTQKQKNFLNAMISVLKHFSGKKRMLVTKYELRKTYGDEMSNMIIDCFIKSGCYDKATSMASLVSVDQLNKYAKGIKE